MDMESRGTFEVTCVDMLVLLACWFCWRVGSVGVLVLLAVGSVGVLAVGSFGSVAVLVHLHLHLH